MDPEVSKDTPVSKVPRESRGVQGSRGLRRPRGAQGLLGPLSTPEVSKDTRVPLASVDPEASKASKVSTVPKGTLASSAMGRRPGPPVGAPASSVDRLPVDARDPRGAVCPGKGTQGYRWEPRHPRVASCKVGAPASSGSVLQGGSLGIRGRPLARAADGWAGGVRTGLKECLFFHIGSVVCMVHTTRISNSNEGGSRWRR